MKHKHANLLAYVIPTYLVARHSKTTFMGIVYAILVLNVLLFGTPK